VTIFGVLVALAVLQSNPSPAGNAQNGRELFLKYSCYSCHLYNGQGSGNGPRLVPLPMTLPRFTAFMRNPGRMPPYTEKVLTDAQLVDLFAYIKSLPESAPAANIPLLMRIINESKPAR
jgi:ubiquinol-cytochrome c reductase cytochrome c subunit